MTITTAAEILAYSSREGVIIVRASLHMATSHRTLLAHRRLQNHLQKKEIAACAEPSCALLRAAAASFESDHAVVA